MDLVEAAQLGNTGDAGTGFVDLDVVEDEEATALVGGSGGWIEFGRLLTIGVRVQVFNSARF
ncbi:MAG: hypothetical protein WEE89_02655 [Gemmatimonadota bacterium]